MCSFEWCSVLLNVFLESAYKSAFFVLGIGQSAFDPATIMCVINVQ